MCQYDAVQYLSAFNISRLLWGNDGWQDRFESSGDDLGEEFVDDVAKGYGLVLLWSIRLPLFGDEGKEGFIVGP